MKPTSRVLVLAGVLASLASGGCACGPTTAAYAPAPPPGYPPTQPGVPFVGSSYSLATPGTGTYGTPADTANYTPTEAYYGAGSPAYAGGVFRQPAYAQPGPYYYTPAESYTPGYYGYYYTPGYFRY